MSCACEKSDRQERPRLLIVDDEPTIRSALRRWFEAVGFDVDVAEDGDIAVRLCETGTYDLITMDLEMPRMNGREALAAIHGSKPGVPVIILSGYLDRGGDPRLEGASKVLVKPISLHALESEVRRLLSL
jgi:CheY-like chemotaxis protein